MQPLPFNLTPEGVTVIIDGGPRVFQKGTAQYTAIKTELMKDEPDWDRVRESTTKGGALAVWLSQSAGDPLLADFAVGPSGLINFKQEALPEGFQGRAAAMAGKGEDPRPLLRFFARLQQNPSWRSVQQLYPFLQHQGIPVEDDGTFLAYKGVKEDLTDCHTGKISNAPGQIVKFERNQISDDPNHACHQGLHVGAKEYARPFGPVCVICRVKPENVVCIPHDSSQQKMRVCEYEVVGIDAGVDLPSTVADPADIPEPSEQDSEDLASVETPEEFDGGMAGDQGGVETKKSGRSEPAPVRRLARLTPRKLIDETIDSLRAYAAHLKIVGATKIAGGKVALVKAIVKARRSK